MKMLILAIVSLLIVILAGVVARRINTNKPPEFEVKEAGRMLAQSQYEKSPKFAKEIFLEASMYYDSAMTEWKKQNERLIISRNYKKVLELARKSIISSEKAIVKSREAIYNIEDSLEIRIESIGERIGSFEENFGRFPLDKKRRDEFAKCKLLYSECLHAYKNKEYLACKLKLDSVEIAIKDVYSHCQEKLVNYFEDYSKWNKMEEQTISYSKKSQTNVIMVDKLSRELSIYKNGKFFKHYSIELGNNWVGDKMQQGDKSTPEGLYKILDKKQNGQTKYYKAFLLDYPNEEDKKRFLLNKKNGAVKYDAKIGNLIEIHGNGGKGIDWTDGCIALKNNDMDEIFNLCPVGTRVTIVGSTKSLSELSFDLK